nr:MAG TPA: hypothetical protein [Caudoviricetes sp.]
MANFSVIFEYYKKFLTFFQKCVDILVRVWYNIFNIR